MTHIKDIEEKSIFILREAYSRFKNAALLWSIGKDSTTMLWLCKKAFFGKIPFRVLHIDTGYKFKEIYGFRDKYAKQWGLDLVIAKNSDAEKRNILPEGGRFACCNSRKTENLLMAVREHGFDALIAGIRRDEHGIRGKERYFSPRDKSGSWDIARSKDRSQISEGDDSSMISLQDAEMSGWNIFATDFGEGTGHVRIHPLLHWTELDIWEYIRQEDIPVIDLYFARDSKRYRSIGCFPCCNPVSSDAANVTEIISELRKTNTKERDGRAQDKEDEYNMQKLRSLGYM